MVTGADPCVVVFERMEGDAWEIDGVYGPFGEQWEAEDATTRAGFVVRKDRDTYAVRGEGERTSILPLQPWSS